MPLRARAAPVLATTLGVVYALLAGACLSTGGVALRFVESASGWQILAYRAVAFLVFMSVLLALRHGRGTLTATLAIGRAGIAVMVLLGVGAIAYVFAVLNTTVANVVVILSVSPLLTALLASVFLAEHPDRLTWCAMAAALAGVAIMFADGLEAGGLPGIVIALGATLAYSVMLVLMRRAMGRDLLPAIALSGVVTLVLALAMADGLAVSLRDAAIGVFLGTFQFGFGFVLITLAARHIPAAYVALLSLSEVVLAPLWVWLAVDETPSGLALAGGAVVLGAVFGQGLRAVHNERRRAQRPAGPGRTR